MTALMCLDMSCVQVPRGASHTHFKSSPEARHTLRAGETDGVEADCKNKQVTDRSHCTQL